MRLAGAVATGLPYVWLSSSTVSVTGADLAAFVVNPTDYPLSYGNSGTFDRWTGRSWESAGRWILSGAPSGGAGTVGAGPDVVVAGVGWGAEPGGVGPAEYFSVPPLPVGRYRVGHAGVAYGVIEVVEETQPLPALNQGDGLGYLFARPSLVHPSTAQVRLHGHLIGARASWKQDQFTAAFGPTVTLRRWGGTEWQRVTVLDVLPTPDPHRMRGRVEPSDDDAVTLQPLSPGAYQLERHNHLIGPLTTVVWVTGDLPESIDTGQTPLPPVLKAQPVGRWTTFPAGPLATRGEPTAVWTGKEMLVVGGLLLHQYQVLNDGAAYNPATQEWRRIASRPDPGRILGGVWTGQEMIVFGTESLEPGPLRSAHAYDPIVDRWRRIAAIPEQPRGNFTLTWTGERVLLFQPGQGAPSAATLGGLYDPAADSWTDVPPIDLDGITSLFSVAAWSGEELAVLGTTSSPSGGPVQPGLFFLDPHRPAWRSAASPPADLSRPHFTPIWAGQRLVVLGSPSFAYNGAEDRWQPIADLPGETVRNVRQRSVVALDDGRLLVGGGQVIGSFDTIAGEANHVVPTPPPPVAISDGAMVSTGKTVLVWGITSQGIFVQGDAPNGALEYQVQ